MVVAVLLEPVSLRVTRGLAGVGRTDGDVLRARGDVAVGEGDVERARVDEVAGASERLVVGDEAAFLLAYVGARSLATRRPAFALTEPSMVCLGGAYGQKTIYFKNLLCAQMKREGKEKKRERRTNEGEKEK